MGTLILSLFFLVIIQSFLAASTLHVMKRKSSVKRFCKPVRDFFSSGSLYWDVFFFFMRVYFCFSPGSLSNYSLKLLKIGMFFDIKELLEDFSNPKVVFQGVTSIGLCS